jgi:hypothetical protein
VLAGAAAAQARVGRELPGCKPSQGDEEILAELFKAVPAWQRDLRPFRWEAESLVSKHRAAVHRLAVALDVRGELEGEEIARIARVNP